MDKNLSFIKDMVNRAFDPFSVLTSTYYKRVKDVEEYIERSRAAQAVVAGYTQEQIDNLTKVMAKAVFDNAEELAKMAEEETGIGCADHKIIKNQAKSTSIYAGLRGKKSVGVISEDKELGLVTIAKPMGVIGAVSPTTNPTITPLGNALFAVKCANSIIISPHPRSVKTTAKTIDYMQAAVEAAGGPKDLILCIQEPDIDTSQALMKRVDVVLATGGPDLVDAAYSSGKPAYGVGPGNVPGIVDRGVDFDQTAAWIIEGRAFDLGVICAGNQSIIVHKDDYKAMKEACERGGAYWVEDPAVIDKLRKTLFINGKINKDVIGQVPATIGKLAGVNIPEESAVLIMKGTGIEDELCKEKMCTAIVALEYDTFEEAVDMAVTSLEKEGIGHTAVVYSNDDKKIIYAGEKLPVARILVNQPGHTAGGDVGYNGLNGTVSLGCGSWGNNIISENLTYYHLMNTSVVAYNKPSPYQFDPETLWD